MMTGSLVTEWLTVTTGLFSFFFLLSAFAWILSRDHKIDDVEKQHVNSEEEGYYIITNNNSSNNITESSKNSVKTDTTSAPTIQLSSMPSPMARAMLPCTTAIQRNMITIENDSEVSMVDDRTILNSSIPQPEPPPLPSIPFFRPPPPPPPTCMLGPVTHNYLTWWLHTKNHSTPDG